MDESKYGIFYKLWKVQNSPLVQLRNIRFMQLSIGAQHLQLMESLLDRYNNDSSSDEESQPMGLLSQQEDSSQSDEESNQEQCEEPSEKIEEQKSEDEIVAEPIPKRPRLMLPSFVGSKAQPKYLQQTNASSHFTLLNSHKQASTFPQNRPSIKPNLICNFTVKQYIFELKPTTDKPTQALLLQEEVISKQPQAPTKVIEKAEQEMGVIEKKIAQQKQRINPFKKSAVVSTTWEVRESRREKGKAKQDRIEKRRVDKEKQKKEGNV